MIVSAATLDSVPLGRRKLLAGASAAMAGLATRLWFPERASAAPPNGCFGYNGCSCCSGSTCCRSDCRSGYYGCPSGGQCWTTCAYDGSILYRFRCCDWGTGGSPCICRARLGAC